VPNGCWLLAGWLIIHEIWLAGSRLLIFQISDFQIDPEISKSDWVFGYGMIFF
jgi:hypothetical protein